MSVWEATILASTWRSLKLLLTSKFLSPTTTNSKRYHLSAMQGFNMGRYVPPEHEGVLSGNQLHRKKPPGHHGSTLTVRFEMPFNIICTHCDGHIAQGVRFNAEKVKVGNYYSTPIWAFKMKHSVCSGSIEIRTDPKNTAYVVTEGGRKQAGAEDVEGGVGVIRVKMPGEKDEELNVMAKLEKQAEEEKRKAIDAPRIEELKRLSDRQWADPYEHSKRMRKIFRTERKRLESQAASGERIREKFGLAIEVVGEEAVDEVTARNVEFAGEEDDGVKLLEVRGRPMFVGMVEGEKRDRVERRNVSEVGPDGRKKTRAQIQAEETRAKLEQRLRRNTRSRIDPFLAGFGSGGSSNGGGGGNTPALLVGLKRRKVGGGIGNGETEGKGARAAPTPPASVNLQAERSATPASPSSSAATTTPAASAAMALVDYRSDSE
ncbi:hypothetical protein BDZ91DRAFT_688742 [Kalaharituber pfeilii]|nr:hypothetical protein BDZ91DRAFT_688742 [Kalaharituber pfeilii]